MTAQPVAGARAVGIEQPSSAAKVLTLLTALLRGDGGAVSLGEVAAAAALPKSTTHRLLKVLEDHGFIERFGQLYRLSGAFVALTEAAQWSPVADLRNTAYPHLARLFQGSEAAAVHIAVLRGRSVHYVDKLMRPDGVRLPTRVGGRFPAACTALGKAMLAVGPAEAVEELLTAPLPRATPHSVMAHGRLLKQLQRARGDGFVVEQEEACHGFACVAAPILSGDEAVAAVSVTLTTVVLSRLRTGGLDGVGRLVTSTADAIGATLSAAEHGVPAAGTVHSLRGQARIDSQSSNSKLIQEHSLVN